VKDNVRNYTDCAERRVSGVFRSLIRLSPHLCLSLISVIDLKVKKILQASILKQTFYFAKTVVLCAYGAVTGCPSFHLRPRIVTVNEFES
jgi:hypothetical protein